MSQRSGSDKFTEFLHSRVHQQRSTVELHEELVKAAKRVPGKTARATVEEALRELVATAEHERRAKRSRVSAHLNVARNAVDVKVLQAD